MDLRRCIEFIRRQEKELVCFNLPPDDPLPKELREFFATQNVTIHTAHTASGAPDVAVLIVGKRVLAVVDPTMLRSLLSTVPTADVGIADGDYREILEHLKETTFTASDREQLLYASREVEDRARRVGRGTIHAGFQRVSNIAAEQQIYTDLARRGIEVHTYGQPDAAPPDLDSGTVHAVDADEIGATWFVVFDGGGNDEQKSAMIARERDDGDFYGAWTYDADIVDEVLHHLETAYCTPSDEAQ
jgi:DICT domain-containing protein